MSLVYQDLLALQEQQKRQQQRGEKRQYEYDSDEEVDEGGTWEHKARRMEMAKTAGEATKLTKAAAGKHHIGDFLPPDQLTKFLKKVLGDVLFAHSATELDNGCILVALCVSCFSTRRSRTASPSRSLTTRTAS